MGLLFLSYHILPLIFQLSLLLVEGLAENILLELCARFTKENENTLSDTSLKMMKKSIVTLMNVVGLKDDYSSSTVCGMLANFSVSTERQKKNNNGAPNADLICSFIDLLHGCLVLNEKK